VLFHGVLDEGRGRTYPTIVQVDQAPVYGECPLDLGPEHFIRGDLLRRTGMRGQLCGEGRTVFSKDCRDYWHTGHSRGGGKTYGTQELASALHGSSSDLCWWGHPGTPFGSGRRGRWVRE